MPERMFGDIVEPSVKVGTQQWYTIPLSILVHTVVVLAIIIAPLMAAVVLPVQYSTCWRALASSGAVPGATLHRANGFQTLLRFSVQVDATFVFDFGLFRNVDCRSRDAAELKSVGLN